MSALVAQKPMSRAVTDIYSIRPIFTSGAPTQLQRFHFFKLQYLQTIKNSQQQPQPTTLSNQI